jgi:hypothetical protein
VHWISTAVVLGAFVAAVALVEPADASQPAPVAGRSSGVRPAAAPDPRAAVYPLVCAPGAKVDVVSQVSGDLDGDGRPETVAVVRCHSDTGTPPSGVYILSAPLAEGAPPRIAETLVNPKDDRQITHFRLDGRTVKATVLGFSGDSVPRCCPDLSRTYAWQWRDGRYVAIPGPVPNSI